MRTKNILLLALLVSSSISLSQQTRQTNVYQYNTYSLNPAYAGYSGCTEINFSHLNQWVNIDGAPVTNYFNANTRIGKNFGIGGDVLFDRVGMSNHFSSTLGLSYGFYIKNEHLIRFGLGAGFYQLRFDPTSAIALESGDVIVESGAQTANAMNTDLGIFYNFRGLELSFSSQQVVETRSKLDYPGLEGYTLERHFKGFVAYNLPVSQMLSLKPSVLYKGISGQQQFDINLDVNYNDLFFGGLGFRTDVGLVSRVGMNIRKMFMLAYAYEVPMMNLSGYSAGSHEILIGLKLCKSPKESPLDIAAIEPVHDTITIVETKVDTMIVEKIDTVFLQSDQALVSNAEVKRAMLNASETLEFEFDKAVIAKNSYEDLDALTNLLLVRSDLKIRLEGHTDDRGTEDYNMRLSRNRVEAIKKYFVMNGVDPDRIELLYFGEKKPIASNDTDEGRAMNRRVVIEIVE